MFYLCCISRFSFIKFPFKLFVHQMRLFRKYMALFASPFGKFWQTSDGETEKIIVFLKIKSRIKLLNKIVELNVKNILGSIKNNRNTWSFQIWVDKVLLRAIGSIFSEVKNSGKIGILIGQIVGLAFAVNSKESSKPEYK